MALVASRWIYSLSSPSVSIDRSCFRTKFLRPRISVVAPSSSRVTTQERSASRASLLFCFGRSDRTDAGVDCSMCGGNGHGLPSASFRSAGGTPDVCTHRASCYLCGVSGEARPVMCKQVMTRSERLPPCVRACAAALCCQDEVAVHIAAAGGWRRLPNKASWPAASQIHAPKKLRPRCCRSVASFFFVQRLAPSWSMASSPRALATKIAPPPRLVLHCFVLHVPCPTPPSGSSLPAGPRGA